MAIKDNILHQRLVLDVNSTDSLNVVEMKQGDKSSRFVDIILVASGEPIDISTLVGEGGKAKIIASMKGELRQNDEATINKEDNSITVEMSENALGEAGNLDCEIRLTDSSRSVLSSALFIVRVGKSAAGKNNNIVDLSEECLESKNYKKGSIFPEHFDRAYWEKKLFLSNVIKDNATLFEIVGFVNKKGTLAVVNLNIYNHQTDSYVNGICEAFGVSFENGDTVYLSNVTDGTNWKINRFNTGTELIPVYSYEIISLATNLDIPDGSITPQKLSKKYLSGYITNIGEVITTLADLVQKIGYINRNGSVGIVRLSVQNSEKETINPDGYIDGEFMAVGSPRNTDVHLFNLRNGESWTISMHSDGTYFIFKVDPLTPRVEQLEKTLKITVLGIVHVVSELISLPLVNDRVYFFRTDAQMTTLVGNGYCIGRCYDKTEGTSTVKMMEIFNSTTLKTWALNTKDSTATLVSECGLKSGSVTPDFLDRAYWELKSRVNVTGYDYFDSMLSEDTAANSIYRVEFSGLSPIKSVVGEGSFIAVIDNNADFLTLFNLKSGAKWTYTKGSSELVLISDTDNTVENLGSLSDVETLSGLKLEKDKVYRFSLTGELAESTGVEYSDCLGTYGFEDGPGGYLRFINLETSKGGFLWLNTGGYEENEGAVGPQGPQGEKGDTGAQGSQGEKGEAGEDGYTPVKGVDYFTEEDKAEIVKDVIESLGGSPVFGYVDENNNIVVSGNLAEGSYSVKYEMEDGSTVDIGSLVLSDEESEEPEEPAEYTNFCVPDGDGWIDGGRCSSAGEDRTDNQGYYLTNYIAVKNGDVVYVKNFDITTTTPVNQYCGMYDAEKAPIKGFIMTDSGATGYCKDIDLSGEVEQFTIDNANAGYVRIVGGLPSGKTKADIVINIKRDGQWL